MPGPSAAFTHKHKISCFFYKNDGAFRSEIKVEINSIDGIALVVTVTRHEQSLGMRLNMQFTRKPRVFLLENSEE